MYIIAYVLFSHKQKSSITKKVVRPPHIIKTVAKEQIHHWYDITQTGNKKKKQKLNTLEKNLLFATQELILSK